MIPNTLRQLDRYLGTPLCALLSGIRRVARLFFGFQRVEPRDKTSRVLFIQLAEGGSMILASPAIRQVITSGFEAWFVTFEENAPALALTGLVPADKVFTIRCGNAGQITKDVFRLLGWMRKNDLDTVIDLELFSRATAAFSFVSGARHRVGFHAESAGALYRGHLMTHPVPFNPHQHMSTNYLQLVRSLTSSVTAPSSEARPLDVNLQKKPANATWAYRVSNILHDQGIAPGTRLVLINANASDRLVQRRWPASRFAELIQHLLAIRPDCSVLLIGSASDHPTNAGLMASVGHYANLRCFNIAGKLPIDVLPALFERSAILVSNDSGPAHFASVTNLPTVVLFGPETPVLFAPLGTPRILTAQLPCSPCVSVFNQRQSQCRDNQCMQQIPVARVLEATLDCLQHAADRHRHGQTSKANQA